MSSNLSAVSQEFSRDLRTIVSWRLQLGISLFRIFGARLRARCLTEETLTIEHSRIGKLVTNSATPNPRPDDLARTCAGWFGICFLLFLQLLILVEFAQREIVWGYPAAFDQTVFLSKAYETYDHILTENLRVRPQIRPRDAYSARQSVTPAS